MERYVAHFCIMQILTIDLLISKWLTIVQSLLYVSVNYFILILKNVTLDLVQVVNVTDATFV